MARFVIVQFQGQMIWLNPDHVATVKHRTGGGAEVKMATGEVINVETPPATIVNPPAQ